MKLIQELTEDVQYLVEEREGRKNLFIEGVFLQAGVKNRNGRIYPPPVMERETDRYIREKINRGNAYGEFGHPPTPQLNMERISHIVTSLKRSGNDYVGKARIIDEGMGKIARGIIEAEGKLGVSSRGMGTLREDKKLGANVVGDDYVLVVCSDIVADPSAPSAWVNGVMESVDWVLNEQGEWERRAIESIRETIHSTPSSLLPERKLELFESFIEGLVETQMVDTLAKSAKLTKSQASAVIRKARIKARAQGHPNDARLVWQHARSIINVSGR